ncbi:MAG: hypothetical protein KZQ65_01845 [Candidatus Thiodiazotropha sp. (ex Gloverina cf. vestifex)]|nr:hypothetical protein [Candidatus Thiodiazotropha sp. (ex Gloverina cf. vestifex)]
MDLQRPLADELGLMADHIRLLAALMLKWTGLQESERLNFSLVLQDLAGRLERMAVATPYNKNCRLCAERESRH